MTEPYRRLKSLGLPLLGGEAMMVDIQAIGGTFIKYLGLISDGRDFMRCLRAENSAPSTSKLKAYPKITRFNANIFR